MTTTTLKLKRFQVTNAVAALSVLLDGPYHLLHTPKLVLATGALEPVLETIQKTRKLLLANYAQMVEGDPAKGEKPTPLLDEDGNVQFEDPETRGRCIAALEDFDNEEIDVAFPLDACKVHNSDLKATGKQAFALRFFVDSGPKAAPKKGAKP